MAEITQSKKRGRPATGTNPSIGVRLPLGTIEALDRWRASQPGVPGRPEAIRRLIEAGLAGGTIARGPAGPRSSGAEPSGTGKTTPQAKRPPTSMATPGRPLTKEQQLRALRETMAR